MFGLSLKLVDALMDVVCSSKDEIIKELRDQNDRLIRENERLRQRGDLAVDSLLAQANKPSVMPERHHLPSPEDRAAAALRAKELAELKNELERVGDTGGSPEDLVDGKAPGFVEEIQ